MDLSKQMGKCRKHQEHYDHPKFERHHCLAEFCNPKSEELEKINQFQKSEKMVHEMQKKK